MTKTTRAELVETDPISLLSDDSVFGDAQPGRRYGNDPFASSPPKVPEKRNSSVLGTKHARLGDDLEVFGSSPPPRSGQRAEPAPRKLVEWDPISSSAPQLERQDSMLGTKSRSLQRVQSEVIALDDSDVSSLEGSEDDDDFPDIGELDTDKFRALKAKAASMPARKPAAKVRTSKIGTGSRLKALAVKKTAEEREREKEEKAAAKEAEKAAKQREKERVREERALEKQKEKALAEVNKVRTDKKVSTPEMIVDLPSKLNPATKVQAETLLKDLDVETSSWDSPMEDVVKWRRKVNARWDEELDRWEPTPPRIDSETYAMVIMTAAHFVKLTLATDDTDLESHVKNVISAFPNHTIIYLLEGVTPWLRKNRNLRNRQFASAVRSGLPDNGEPSNSQPSASQPSRRRKNPPKPQEYVDEDMIEDALLQLQVLHGVLIHHTNAPVETAQWIATFTQHISTVPYRRQREEANAASAGFCMESGQVRTGDGSRDTYLRMLQEVGRITAPIAYGIAGEFPTVSLLVKGLERGGPLVLENVKKSANKDGAYSDRAIGPSISKRLHKIFTGVDETSTEI